MPCIGKKERKKERIETVWKKKKADTYIYVYTLRKTTHGIFQVFLMIA